MKTDIWMPITIGDYLKDTTHFSCLEHGAYFLILMDLWVHDGKVPLKRLHKVVKMPREQFLEMWDETLSDVLDLDQDGMVSQKRLLIEMQASHSRRESAAQNGRKGGRPKNDEKAKKNPQETGGLAESNPGKSSSSSSSPSSISISSGIRAFRPPKIQEVFDYCQERIKGGKQAPGQISPEHFVDYYATRNWQLGKGVKMKDWKAAVRTWERNANKPQGSNYGV